MSAGHEVMWSAQLVQEHRSRGAGLGLASVELPGHVRLVELERGNVNGVAPDEKAAGAAPPFAGLDKAGVCVCPAR